MERKNPFNITFGVEPTTIISRENEIQLILNDLTNLDTNSTYIITGARGCGKTVFLGIIAEKIRKLPNWIVVDVNPEQDLLDQIASKIYDQGKLKKIFLTTEFNFSFKGIGFTVSGKNPISNVSSFLSQELSYLRKKGIKLLVTIDEVISNQFVKIFAHEYQSFLREKYQINLLMTGLYQNISLLQNQKSLTFLYRTPKLYLTSLNDFAIMNAYKKTFDLTTENSIELAKLTNGYPFAYQLLGDILFKANKDKLDEDILNKFDEIIFERAYSIIFEELTQREKEILFASLENNINGYIINKLNISKSFLSDYKKTLYLKGIIKNNREEIIFVLPRFKEFLLIKKSFVDKI